MTVGGSADDPRGRKFDAERQVVQQVADLGDDLGIAGRGSQPARTARARSVNRAVAVVDQRRDRDLVLAGDAQWRAAGHDDATRRRGVHDGGHLVRRRQDVLHVVEDQDHRRDRR